MAISENHVGKAAHDVVALVLLLLFLRIAQALVRGDSRLRLRRALKAIQGAAELVIGFGQIRVELDNPFEFGDGLRQTFSPRMELAQSEMRRRVARVQIYRPLQALLDARDAGVRLFEQRVGEQVMDDGDVRLYPQRLLETLDAFFIPSGQDFRNPQAGVSLRELRGQFDGAF